VSSPAWRRRRHAVRIRAARRAVVREFVRARREGRWARFKIRVPGQGVYAFSLSEPVLLPYADGEVN
jgi:hypothetical protein